MDMRPKEHQLSTHPVEEKFGTIVVNEEPFITKWVNVNRKEQFYQQYLTSDQFQQYQLLSVFVPPNQKKGHDFVLVGDVFVFYDETIHTQILSFVEKTNPSIYNKLRMYDVTDTMFTQSNTYNDEVKELLTTYFTELQVELSQEVDRLIVENVKPFYEREYMLTNEWEKETGVTVVEEEPFLCYWLDHEKKEAFYDRHLNDDEKELYDVIKSFYTLHQPTVTERATDYILETVSSYRYITFEKEVYHKWISFLAKKHPETYNRYRLGVVTGLTESRQEGSAYEKEENKDIKAFLQEYVSVLRERTDTLIQMHIKSSYKKWKNK